MSKKKICGVIGGMGPMASVDFMVKVIENTKATCDMEHVHMIVDNNTEIADRSSYILNGTKSPEEEIVKTAKSLEKQGADFLVMTCNTAHYFADSITQSVSIPFINMLDETGKVLKKNGIKKVGLLATMGTYASENYEKYTKKYGIEMIIPSEEGKRKVMSSVYDDIKKNGASLKKCDITPLLEVIDELKKSGAEAVILGCTELPLVLNEENAGLRCFDPTLILALASIEYAGYEAKQKISL